MTRKGMDRQKAHELVRRLAVRSTVDSAPFKEVLLREESVSNLLSKREVEEALNPSNYLGTSVKQVEAAIEMTMDERRKRGLA